MCEFCNSYNDPLHWSNAELEEQIKILESLIVSRERDIQEYRNTIKSYKIILRENNEDYL